MPHLPKEPIFLGNDVLTARVSYKRPSRDGVLKLAEKFEMLREILEGNFRRKPEFEGKLLI